MQTVPSSEPVRKKSFYFSLAGDPNCVAADHTLAAIAVLFS